MNPGIETTCFYSTQLTLENREQHASHIGNCRICNKKLQNLIERERSLRKYFDQYKIQQQVYEDLIKDLSKVEKNLYPSTAKNIVNALMTSAPVIKKNSILFVRNILTPKNFALALFAYLFYYFTAA